VPNCVAEKNYDKTEPTKYTKAMAGTKDFNNSTKNRQALFALIDGALKLDQMLVEGFPAKYLPRAAFIFCLCLIYIGLNHQANKITLKINKANTQLEERRVQYITAHAEMMKMSKQSVVADSVKQYGLFESDVPPFKIITEKKH
jgi:hypothetical protein